MKSLDLRWERTSGSSETETASTATGEGRAMRHGKSGALGLEIEVGYHQKNQNPIGSSQREREHGAYVSLDSVVRM